MSGRYEIGWSESIGIGHCIREWHSHFETDSKDEAKKQLLRAREEHPSAVCVDSQNNYALIEP